MVKISVIVPVFNVEKHLKKCLDSILNQTLEDIEIICIDDGSTDSSLEILKDYNDNRLKILTQKNKGAAISRNKGIDLAEGEYITFVDSDDWLELNALEKLYNNAKTNDSDIVLFNAIEIRPENKTHKRIYSLDKNKDYSNFTFDHNYNKRLVMNEFFVVWSKIYKTSFLKDNKLSFYNYPIFNDVQFHIETMILAKKISYCPTILYNYNKLNENSLQTTKSNDNKRLILFDIFNEIEEFLINNNYYDEFKLNFIEFKIKESIINLDKTSIEFKKEFYKTLRREFIKLNITKNILEKLPLDISKEYIRVLINENFDSYEKYTNLIQTNVLKGIYKPSLNDEIENFNDMGINLEKRDYSLIISLTSFPERMNDIHYCLYSLLNQNFKPDEIVLWLAESQFPNKEKDIPQNVLKLKKNGLSIKWCDDLKSYKKIIPSLKQYSDSYIVTADDDFFYPKDWLELIWQGYQNHPNTIISSRTRRITFNQNGDIETYTDWFFPKEITSKYINFPTNGAGTLFFPNSLSDIVFDESLFFNLCPSADDIWIWAMAVLNKTKITSIGNPMEELLYINLAREIGILNSTTLWHLNQDGLNDKQLKNILIKFPQILKIIDDELKR